MERYRYRYRRDISYATIFVLCASPCFEGNRLGNSSLGACYHIISYHIVTYHIIPYNIISCVLYRIYCRCRLIHAPQRTRYNANATKGSSKYSSQGANIYCFLHQLGQKWPQRLLCCSYGLAMFANKSKTLRRVCTIESKR